MYNVDQVRKQQLKIGQYNMNWFRKQQTLENWTAQVTTLKVAILVRYAGSNTVYPQCQHNRWSL